MGNIVLMSANHFDLLSHVQLINWALFVCVKAEKSNSDAHSCSCVSILFVVGMYQLLYFYGVVVLEYQIINSVFILFCPS